MRYDTLGDWFVDEAGDVIIRVSGFLMSNEGFLIALHELVEWKLCAARGISQETVDAFDMAFKGNSEPGDEWNAPYRKEHRFACLLEYMMAHELGQVGYGKIE